MSDTTTPGADELRIRALLLAREVGPDAGPAAEAPARASSARLPDWWAPKPGISATVTEPTAEPTPAVRPRDWLDDILDTDPEPEAEPEAAEEEAPEPEQATPPARPSKPKKRKKKPRPGAPRAAVDTRPTPPRQSLADAWDRTPARLKWLAYHTSAAYLGWSLGLVDWATYVTAWIADTGLVGPQALFWYCAAGATVLIYRRTRGWWRPVAWLAAVPVSSTVVGVLLYAPTT